MSNKLVLVPNKMGSVSAKLLADTLSTKLGYKVWRVPLNQVRNRIPFRLQSGTDKLTQLIKFKENGVSCPEFTTDRAVAVNWINEGFSVVCRTLLQASEGRGIVIADTVDQLVAAPLYTKYFKKKKEFRVHVLNEEVIDIQEKRKKNGFENERDTRIRNTSNGYVFCRDNLVPPTGLQELALLATRSLGYSLGAVDIAWNERTGNLAVFEVNANPGLMGTTLEKYAINIVKWYKEKTQ